MIESRRHGGLTVLRVVLCGFLFSFASRAARAQTSGETAILDTWRVSFNHQLDDQMRELASADHFATISTPSRAQGERDYSSAQASPSTGLAYREPAHWPSAVRNILLSQGLPASLVSVVAVESGFNPMALSPKGAAGLWQFMPGTARQYGLVVNATQDDRFDVLKSTVAAAHYLRQLHDQFGDWPLTLAAYNGGPNRLRQTMQRSSGGDLWTMSGNFSLPRETRGYVPKVLALMRSVSDKNVELPRSTDGVRPGQAPKLLPMDQLRQEQVMFATSSADVSSPL